MLLEWSLLAVAVAAVVAVVAVVAVAGVQRIRLGVKFPGHPWDLSVGPVSCGEAHSRSSQLVSLGCAPGIKF